MVVKCIRRGQTFESVVDAKPSDKLVDVVRIGLPLRQVMARAKPPCGVSVRYLRAEKGV